MATRRLQRKIVTEIESARRSARRVTKTRKGAARKSPKSARAVVPPSAGGAMNAGVVPIGGASRARVHHRRRRQNVIVVTAITEHGWLIKLIRLHTSKYGSTLLFTCMQV